MINERNRRTSIMVSASVPSETEKYHKNDVLGGNTYISRANAREHQNIVWMQCPVSCSPGRGSRVGSSWFSAVSLRAFSLDLMDMECIQSELEMQTWQKHPMLPKMRGYYKRTEMYRKYWEIEEISSVCPFKG